MIINIKQFDCYVDQTFSFNLGLTLIKGESGIGKSTLFRAIIFAITGKPAKSNASIVLHLEKREMGNNDEIIINRKSSHNVEVHVGDVLYNDDEAKIILDKIFSSMELFYIPQKMKSSFIAMKDSERASLLLSVLDPSSTVDDIESNSKKDLNEVLIENKALNMTITMIELPEEPVCKSKEKYSEDEIIKFPTLLNEQESKERNLTNLSRENGMNLIEKNNLLNSNENMRATLASYKEQLATIFACRKEVNAERNDAKFLADLREKRQIINNQKGMKMKITIIEEKIKEKSMMLGINKKEHLAKLKTELDTVNEIYESKNKERLFASKLAKLAKDRDEIRQKIESLNINKEKMNRASGEASIKIEELTKQLGKLLAEHERMKQIVVCPKCKVRYYVVKGTLISSEMQSISAVDIAAQIDNISNQIKVQKGLYQRLLTKETYEQQLKDITSGMTSKYRDKTPEDLYKIYDEMEYQLCENKKDKERRTKECTLFEQNLKDYDSLMKEREDTGKLLAKEKDITDDETFVVFKISELETQEKNLGQLKEKYDNDSRRMKELDNKIRILTNEIEINKATSDKINCVDEKILQTQINVTQKLIDGLRYKIQDSAIYIEYLTKKKEYDKIMHEKIIKQDKIKMNENKIQLINTLLCLIKESRGEALSECLKIINIKLKEYLSVFFPTTDILIILTAEKELKNGNTKEGIVSINACVDGEERKLNQLSGGEYDRVELAITLSLNEIFNFPILMLDECLSSLDTETANSVIKHIQGISQRKLVLLVAHQVEEGEFDNILHLPLEQAS